VTITLPVAEKRFMSMQVINEDEYTPAVFYGEGSQARQHCGEPSPVPGRGGDRSSRLGARDMLNP